MAPDLKTFLSSSSNCLILSHNQITTFPTWLLNMRLRAELRLLGNPIQCSCDTVKQFITFYEVTISNKFYENMLYDPQEFTPMLPDSCDILCENLPDQRLVDIHVIRKGQDCDLSGLGALNFYIKDHIGGCVIAVELLLFLLLAVIFLRDWRNYRRTKHLPWISRHLPDWFPAFPSNHRKRVRGGQKNKERVCRQITMREEDTPYASPVVSPLLLRKFYTQASYQSSEFRGSIRESLTLSNDRWSSASLSPKMRVKFNLGSNDVQRSKSSDQFL